jgi:hypothetical protein
MRDPTTSYPLNQIDQGLNILSLLASLRFATTSQIQRMAFSRITPSERQARHLATRSLRRLFDAGYTRRVPVFATSATSGLLSPQLVHVLSAQGAAAVSMEARQARSRAPHAREVLTHDFWLVELATLAIEAAPPPLAVTHWWDDRTLAGRKRQGSLNLPNIPDAYLLVENLDSGKPYPFLVELDLGTESVTARSRTRRDFSRKIEGYLGYLGAPFRQDFGINAPPVVLIVTDSERRLETLRDTSAQLGGGGRYWFSTLDRLRGIDDSKSTANIDSADRRGTFWAPNWQTAQDSGWRSLESRCGT